MTVLITCLGSGLGTLDLGPSSGSWLSHPSTLQGGLHSGLASIPVTVIGIQQLLPDIEVRLQRPGVARPQENIGGKQKHIKANILRAAGLGKKHTEEP